MAWIPPSHHLILGGSDIAQVISQVKLCVHAKFQVSRSKSLTGHCEGMCLFLDIGNYTSCLHIPNGFLKYIFLEFLLRPRELIWALLPTVGGAEIAGSGTRGFVLIRSSLFSSFVFDSQ